jgi:hypothetical protein
MVNNSIKKNNDLPPQLIQPPKKRPQHMTLEIQVLVWDKHKNVIGLTESPTYTNNKKKCTDF